MLLLESLRIPPHRIIHLDCTNNLSYYQVSVWTSTSFSYVTTNLLQEFHPTHLRASYNHVKITAFLAACSTSLPTHHEIGKARYTEYYQSLQGHTYSIYTSPPSHSCNPRFVLTSDTFQHYHLLPQPSKLHKAPRIRMQSECAEDNTKTYVLRLS
ncbi:hypothetical protein BDQ17DRAFT_115705 [Cyathus striatus]|nr:hypothetical protein BDQ17DRAFT_115705 [Cyathus striatus]